MNVKFYSLSLGALFFAQAMQAQRTTEDTATKRRDIEEVVILGYNKTLTKPKDVSANTTITSEILENRPNASFLNSIQGAAPGVTIASNSGSPGSARIDIIIRGISSMNASTEPLIVVDGVPTNSNQFRNINTEDIESVSILRDAAATSIYGNRGANGVVLVKTKQGRFNSPLIIGYSGTTGISVLPDNKYNIADARELLTIQKNNNTLLGRTLTDAEIANYPTNTNWRDVFFNADIINQHNLTATFGGDNVSVYNSLGYFDQGGLVPNTNFKRFTFRNTVNGKSANSRLTYNTVVGLAFSKRNQLGQESNSGLNGNVIQNPLLGSLMGLPYLQPGIYSSGQDMFNRIGSNYSANGGFIYVLEDVLRDKSIFNRFLDTNMFVSTTVGYKLTDYLALNNRTGADYKIADSYTGRYPLAYLSLVVAAGANTQYGGGETIGNTKELNFNSVTSLNFDKQFDLHRLMLGAYMEYTKVHYLMSTRTQNGLDPRTFEVGTGTGYIPFSSTDPNKYLPSVGAGKIDAGALAYFGTLDYDFADKYGVSAVLRRDASYRFVEDNKWATFWSVGARWNIDKENFMADSIFSMLKLRGSYGTQGNANVIAPAAGSNAMLLGTAIVRDLNATNTGYGNVPGYGVSSIGNVSLQWEEVTQANIGLDFRLWQNKFEGSFDVYNKQTDKLYTNVNSSAITGFYTYNGNYGGLRNRGLEVNLRYNAINNANGSLSFYANTAYNENTITDLQIPVQTGSLIQIVGGPLSQWNLVRYVGVDPETGREQFLDKDGNITYTPVDADRVQTGKNFFPKYNGGFGLNSTYKSFFVDVSFSYQAKLWRSDNQLTWALNPAYMRAGYNVSADLLNAWTPTNRNTDVPALNQPLYSSISDRMLFDASFLRFKNLTFGYSVPRSYITEKAGIRTLKIFFQGENLYTWSKWRGYDPEGLGTFPLSIYPNPRTFSIGTNIEF